MPNQAKATIVSANNFDLSWEAGAAENDFYASAGWGLTAATRADLVTAGDSNGCPGISIVTDAAFTYDSLLTVYLYNDLGTIKWAWFSSFLGASGYITTNHTEADVFHLVEISSQAGVGLSVRIDGDDYGLILSDVTTPTAIMLQFGTWGYILDGEYFVENVEVGTTAYGSSDLFSSTFAASFTGWGVASAISPSTLTAVTDEFGGGGTAVATAATDVSATEATFNGYVNPAGVQSNAYFEYGRTVSYGAATTAVDVGDGVANVPVIAVVGGMQPALEYHYRLVLNTGVAPTPPPTPPGPSAFGVTLDSDYPRLAESGGSTISVSTLAQLIAAFSSVSNGDTIAIVAEINGGGSTLFVTRNASAIGPITITGAGRLRNFSQIYVTGAYLRFRGIPIQGGYHAGIKITDGANNIEVDGCEIYETDRQGILVTSSAQNVQLWNNIIHDNGNIARGNQDHGIYFSYARGACVVANNLVYHNAAYNIQVYSDAPDLLLTCNTVDDGMAQSQDRGGIVVGSEDFSSTRDTINVGMLTTNAAWYGVDLYKNGPGNNTYDAIGFGNGIGDFKVGSGMTYTNCIHADPLYVNQAARNYHLQGGSPAIDHIDAARYGLVPPLDIEGVPRTTADAGCYAF